MHVSISNHSHDRPRCFLVSNTLQTGRCFICLQKNHTSREYRSTMKCGKCGGRHHVSICGESQQEVPVVNAPTKNDSSQHQQGLQQPTLPISPSLCYVNVRSPVLLQTARTTVYKLDNPDKNKAVRFIFTLQKQLRGTYP